MSREKISIIIPVFNEQEIIEKSINKVIELSESISPKLDTEIIIVNDGSTDNTLKIIEGLKHKIKIISFTRNFGHQMAITAGIDLCKGDFVALLDADLQDPPKYIQTMLEMCLENNCELVYGVRNERPGESFFKKISASIFYKVINLMSETEIYKNSGDFGVFTRKAANEAKERAQEKFNLTDEDLLYFRTIHSLCFMQLGMNPSGIMQKPHFVELGKLLGVEVTGMGLMNEEAYNLSMPIGDRLFFLDNLSRISGGDGYSFIPDASLLGNVYFPVIQPAIKPENNLAVWVVEP